MHAGTHVFDADHRFEGSHQRLGKFLIEIVGTRATRPAGPKQRRVAVGIHHGDIFRTQSFDGAGD